MFQTVWSPHGYVPPTNSQAHLSPENSQVHLPLACSRALYISLLHISMNEDLILNSIYINPKNFDRLSVL